MRYHPHSRRAEGGGEDTGLAQMALKRRAVVHTENDDVALHALRVDPKSGDSMQALSEQAGMLVIFLMPKAIMMHPFWKEKDPMARRNGMSHFMKDLALAGAALFIAYYSGSAWPMAVAAP